MDSWSKLMELMKRYPKDFKYIFKHFPFQPQGRTFELSEMAAAAQEVSNEAFWVVHDFFFTKEGQDIANLEKGAMKQKVEQLLKGKGYDVRIFQSALETGTARNRVLADMALANRFRMTSTPTKIVNGDLIVGSTGNGVLEKYLSE
jgi:protein-disulfide isomerase